MLCAARGAYRDRGGHHDLSGSRARYSCGAGRPGAFSWKPWPAALVRMRRRWRSYDLLMKFKCMGAVRAGSAPRRRRHGAVEFLGTVAGCAEPYARAELAMV